MRRPIPASRSIQKLPGESYATAIATRVQGGNAMEIAASTVYGPTPDWDAQRKAGKVTFAGTPG